MCPSTVELWKGKMPEVWYSTVGPETRLTQGDLIFDCPIVGWREETARVEGAGEGEMLKQSVDAFVADMVVMTQACDLEHEKVVNVVLCPHYSLGDYRRTWEDLMRQRNQNPSEKAWRSHCDDVREGLVWNLTILNSLQEGAVTTEHRIVDFHQVFTVPRRFLEGLLASRKKARLRLLPPYREHLSQAFARFFMRVGLPVEVAKAW
jgi:hypothetical protein